MDSSRLTPQQITVLLSQLAGKIEYLRRLRERMKARGFPAEDPVRLRALFALETLEALSATLRQIEVERAVMMGTGAKSKREWQRQQRDRRNG